MAEKSKIVIKKYPNRRLYNTEISSYITLEELGNMVKQGKDFVVVDAKSNEDLTRITLTQIILEHESKGYELLPLEFLKNIIRFYDHSMANVFQFYLSASMDYFLKNQESMREMFGPLSQDMVPFPNQFTQFWDDVYKHNQQMISLFFNTNNNKK